MKTAIKLFVIVPIALVWDIFYATVQTIYDVCTWVDRKGEKFLDRHFD